MKPMVILFCFAIASALRRLGTQSSDCLDFNSDKFPLKVEKLLASSANKKQIYFNTLRSMGIDQNLKVVGKRLDFTCLKQSKEGKLHIFFVGDSTQRQLHIKFLENHGMVVTEEEKNQRMAFTKAWQQNLINGTDTKKMLLTLAGDESFGDGKDYDISSTFTSEGDTTTYIGWMGEMNIIDKLVKLANLLKPEDTLVFWMGQSVHLFQHKRAKLLAPWQLKLRDTTQRSHIAEFRRKILDKFPQSTLVLDTMQYLDPAMMLALPPKPDANQFLSGNVSSVKMAEIDEKICTELGIAYTDRNKLGRFYRGLSADGMHFDAFFGAEKNYNEFYELVMQSGLARACTKKPANYCKDLDKYDPL